MSITMYRITATIAIATLSAAATVNSAVSAHATGPANLRRGSRGPNVGCIQHALNVIRRYHPAAVPYTLIIDDIFGERTDRDVRSFQHAVAISDDGVVGPTTRRKLDNQITYDASLHRADGEAARLYYGGCIVSGDAY